MGSCGSVSLSAVQPTSTSIRITSSETTGDARRSFEVFMAVEAEPQQVERVRQMLAADQQVESFTFLDHAKAFAVFKELPPVKDSPDLFDGIGPEDLPESFRVTAISTAALGALPQRYERLDGVWSVVSVGRWQEMACRNRSDLLRSRLSCGS
jgi:cell division protein FtsX